MADAPQRISGITRTQFDAVMRRAAELASRGPDPDAGEVTLTDAEVIRIGREVGLEERHVRAALSEVRVGPPESGGILDWIFGPTAVRGARVVPGAPATHAQRLDTYFTEVLLFERLRRGPRVLQYRPRQDVFSKVARFVRFGSRRMNLVSAVSVDVALDPVGEEPVAEASATGGPTGAEAAPGGASRAGQTFVGIHVESGSRSEYLWGAVALGSGLGLSLAGGGVAAAVLGFGVPLVLALIGGAGAASAVLWLTARGFGSVHRRNLAELGLRVEGVLDQLEHGELLEPPTSPWGRKRRR